jgi:hypothetical protein
MVDPNWCEQLGGAFPPPPLPPLSETRSQGPTPSKSWTKPRSTKSPSRTVSPSRHPGQPCPTAPLLSLKKCECKHVRGWHFRRFRKARIVRARTSRVPTPPAASPPSWRQSASRYAVWHSHRSFRVSEASAWLNVQEACHPHRNAVPPHTLGSIVRLHHRLPVRMLLLLLTDPPHHRGSDGLCRMLLELQKRVPRHR